MRFTVVSRLKNPDVTAYFTLFTYTLQQLFIYISGKYETLVYRQITL